MATLNLLASQFSPNSAPMLHAARLRARICCCCFSWSLWPPDTPSWSRPGRRLGSVDGTIGYVQPTCTAPLSTMDGAGEARLVLGGGAAGASGLRPLPLTPSSPQRGPRRRPIWSIDRLSMLRICPCISMQARREYLGLHPHHFYLLSDLISFRFSSARKKKFQVQFFVLCFNCTPILTL